MTTAPAMEKQNGRLTTNPASLQGFQINDCKHLHACQNFTFKIFPTSLKAEPLPSYYRLAKAVRVPLNCGRVRKARETHTASKIKVQKYEEVVNSI